MKRLFKIGVLLLFMIGIFAVQAGFSTPVLVDDDVGVEFIDNMDYSNDAVITANLEIQAPVMVQLECPFKVDVETMFKKVKKGVCFEASVDLTIKNMMIIRDGNYTPGKVLTNLTREIKECEINASEQTDMIMGLFRLDIGENS